MIVYVKINGILRNGITYYLKQSHNSGGSTIISHQNKKVFANFLLINNNK